MLRLPTLLCPAILALSSLSVLGLPAAAQTGKPDDSAPPPSELVGSVGNWSLYRTGPAAHPVSCTAYMFSGSEEGLRFEARADQTAIGFIGYATAADATPLTVTIWFDNDRDRSDTYVLPLETDETGLGWRNYRSPNSAPEPLLDAFANDATMHFAYRYQGEQVASYSLAGSNRAMRAALDCAMPGSSETPVVPERAAGQPYVIRGTCRLVVDGRTYLDRRGDCPIWMTNDGTGSFWINTDRDGYLGDYFAELEPAGDGTAQGHWNGSPGATHAEGFLGEDFRMGAGGCWSNARATICAAR
ncbi:MAG: hypothetical protein KDK12_19530 [Rhodobacteraceae bacterium]|nr:hypothetical protein [Paracoccaceae bacterium]